MTYDKANGVQRVATRTDALQTNPDETWSISTHFGEGEITLTSTFDSAGYLVSQKQKNGAIVTSTTDTELKSIWSPRNLW